MFTLMITTVLWLLWDVGGKGARKNMKPMKVWKNELNSEVCF